MKQLGTVVNSRHQQDEAGDSRQQQSEIAAKRTSGQGISSRVGEKSRRVLRVTPKSRSRRRVEPIARNFPWSGERRGGEVLALGGRRLSDPATYSYVNFIQKRYGKEATVIYEVFFTNKASTKASCDNDH